MTEIYRELTTPDGTILVSRHRHDYVTHEDENGKHYMLDGGLNSGYFRYSTNGDESIMTIYAHDDFEIVRKYMYRWNTNRKEHVTLENMEVDWLDNITLWYLTIPNEKKRRGQIQDDFLLLYIKEKQFRNEIEENAEKNAIETYLIKEEAGHYT